jgi:hypothetical protein
MHLGPNLNNPLYLYEYGRIIIHIYETDKVNEYL